jgi:hypothetical protein
LVLTLTNLAAGIFNLVPKFGQIGPIGAINTNVGLVRAKIDRSIAAKLPFRGKNLNSKGMLGSNFIYGLEGMSANNYFDWERRSDFGYRHNFFNIILGQ